MLSLAFPVGGHRSFLTISSRARLKASRVSRSWFGGRGVDPIALARAKGVAPEVIVRAALEKTLADAAEPSDTSATGAALVAVMQASPYRDVDFQSTHD